MENKTSRLAEIITIAAIFLALVAAVTIGNLVSNKVAQEKLPETFGIATSPARSVAATSSTEQVGPQQVKTIFAANESCASRLIGTRAQEIILTLDLTGTTSPTPTFAVGYPVAASTTRSFPADEFGCGAIKAYAAASTTITKGETIR